MKLIAFLGRVPPRWLALLLCCIYLLSYSGVIHSVDELSALSAAESAWAGQGWRADQMEWDQERTPPQNIGGVDGHLYSKKGLGVSAAALPLLALGKALGGFGAVQLVLLAGAPLTALAAYAFYYYAAAQGYSRGASALAMLALGLATPLWPYARTLPSETLGALGLAAALAGAALFRHQRGGGAGCGPLALTGGGLALLMLAKSSNAVVAPVFALYLAYVVLWEERGAGNALRASAEGRLRLLLRQAACVGLPLLVGVALTVAYNYARFHTLLTFPLEPSEQFSTPLRTGLPGLLLSPGKGLFWYMPVLWLALLGGAAWRSRLRADLLLALGSLLATVLIYALWFDWAGGRAWGPRMIIHTAPAALALALPGLAALAEPAAAGWRRWAAGLLLLASFAVQLPGVLLNFELREAAVVKLGSTHHQLVWDVRHAPPLTTWTGPFEGLLDPIWLRPYLTNHPARAAALAAAAAAALALAAAGMERSARGRPARLLWPAALAAAAGLALLTAWAAAPDPRWNERTAEPDDTRAALAFVEADARPGDVVILETPRFADAHGRQAFWMNESSAPLPTIGWSRKPAGDSHERLRAWLAEYDRAWLSLLLTDEGDPASTTEQMLDGWAYQGRRQWAGDQRLVEYFPPPAAPAGAPALAGAQFGPELALAAAYLDPAPEGAALVRLEWGGPAPADLRFSLQALDAGGALVAQLDRAPAAAAPYTDRAGLALPPEAATLILKVYNRQDGAPLPATLPGADAAEYLILSLQL